MAELKRVLSKKVITFITINSILGTGLFFLPAKGAGTAGSASIISWLVLAAIAVYTIMCFGELVSMFPKSGGIYEYSKRAYGILPSFMMGWLTWIVENVTIAMLVVGAIDYIMPQGLLLHKILVSLLLVALFNYITFRGVQTSANMLLAFACITLTMAFFVIVTSLIDINALMNFRLETHFDIENLRPFFTQNGFLANLSVIAFTVFLISETFFGFEGICFLAGETRDPERVLPKSLLLASLLAVGLTMVFVISTLGTTSDWSQLSQVAAPFADLIATTTGTTAQSIFVFGVFFAIVGSAAGLTVTTPRLILSLAEDKLFPTSFARIHEKRKTPYNAILFQTVVVSLLIVFTLIQEDAYLRLVKLLVILVTIMMSFVIVIVPIMRRRLPHHERPFKVPFANVGVPVIIMTNILLVIAWFMEDATEAIQLLKLGGSLLLFGVPIFLLLVTYYDPDIIVKIGNILAYLNLACERLLLPKKVIQDIDTHLEDVKGKKILEFGCGVGSLTKELLKKVGPDGYIYATDMSFTSVEIARQRMLRRGHSNVWFLHDIHQMNRVHDSIPNVDIVVSFGMLGYIQDIKKVLREIAVLLPEGGKVFFIDYVDLFKVIPNVSWLSDEKKLIELFRECGFAVHVRKIKMSMWNYLYVYGMKSEYDVPFV
ncbi:amino acid permease [Candidatus Woesearchaeota archaeon]|nr:amino acid permease [Candidatus Woesearchaeota archaeon]